MGHRKTQKLNVLVLENVDELDFEISQYLKKNYPETIYNVNIITRLTEQPKEKIVKAFSEASIIVFQSMLNGAADPNQVSDMLDLMLSMNKSYLLEIINHGLLVQTINLDFSKENKKKVEKLLELSNINEVVYEKWEETTKGSEFYPHIVHTFDSVPVAITDGTFHHTRNKCLPIHPVSSVLSTETPIFTKKGDLIISLTKDEVEVLNRVLVSHTKRREDQFEEIEIAKSTGNLFLTEDELSREEMEWLEEENLILKHFKQTVGESDDKKLVTGEEDQRNF